MNRIKIESGSFFETVPSGGDVYLLSHIIHDWSEAQCLGKILDIIMLAVPGGQERTEPEYRALFDKAGFRLKRVVPTESAASVVEAVLA